MKKVERKLLVEAVEKIISKNGSEIFRDPVDWKQYGLFDYLTIIRKPMDLRTVLNSLNSDSYSSIERCTSDIRQIWQNAMIYNAPGSKVYIAAQHMSQVWEQMFASIFSKYEDCSRPPNLQEMSEWVGMCQSISTKSMGVVLKLLAKHCPHCLVKKDGQDEVEVNVDLISFSGYRHTMEYMRQPDK